MKNSILTFVFILVGIGASAQIGAGITGNLGIYNRYTNPDDEIQSESAGSFLLNFGVGPKLWLGGQSVTLSLEAVAEIGLLGLSIKDYKGLGMASFPIMARLNFNGLSTMDKEARFGISVGVGMQFSKTELYYLDNEFQEQGGERDFFKTYVGEIAYGFGLSGVAASVFVRYGRNADTSANSFNFGINYDFNFVRLKEIDDPESAL